MDFLELRQARGVYSRVTTGMPILNGNLFSEVRNLSRYDGQLRNEKWRGCLVNVHFPHMKKVLRTMAQALDPPMLKRQTDNVGEFPV